MPAARVITPAPMATAAPAISTTRPLAAQALRDQGADRVAVLDIDAHHGNGTQAIFYAQARRVLRQRARGPGAGWFPHYMGFADERGDARRSRARTGTCRWPPGAGDGHWLAGVASLCDDARSHGAEAIVLSLGVDAAGADPESPLQVSADGYRAAGELIGALGPVAVIQEGGYDLVRSASTCWPRWPACRRAARRASPDRASPAPGSRAGRPGAGRPAAGRVWNTVGPTAGGQLPGADAAGP